VPVPNQNLDFHGFHHYLYVGFEFEVRDSLWFVFIIIGYIVSEYCLTSNLK
jgi:hypothetical protein